MNEDLDKWPWMSKANMHTQLDEGCSLGHRHLTSGGANPPTQARMVQSGPHATHGNKCETCPHLSTSAGYTPHNHC